MTASSLSAGISRQAISLHRQRVGGCSARTTAVAILVAALLVAANLFYVWSRTEIVRQAYTFSQLAQDIQNLTDERERLRLEMVQLESPERIATIAREQLGLQFPEPYQIIVVNVGESAVKPAAFSHPEGEEGR